MKDIIDPEIARWFHHQGFGPNIRGYFKDILTDAWRNSHQNHRPFSMQILEERRQLLANFGGIIWEIPKIDFKIVRTPAVKADLGRSGR